MRPQATDIKPPQAAVLMTPASARKLKGIPASFKLAAIAMSRIVSGSITVELPDGQRLLFQGDKPGFDAELQIHDFATLKRVLSQGDIGFAEGLMAGEWDTPDLPVLLGAFSSNLDLMPTLLNGGPLWQAINGLRHKLLNKNTKKGSKKNILAHYDLGNRFYERWLDPSMTYSSGVYQRGDEDLSEAQANKYQALAEKISLQQIGRAHV